MSRSIQQELRDDAARFERDHEPGAELMERMPAAAWRALGEAREAESRRGGVFRRWGMRLMPLALAGAGAALALVVHRPLPTEPRAPAALLGPLGDTASAAELIETLDPPALARLYRQLDQFATDDNPPVDDLDPISELPDEALPAIARRLGGG